MKQGVGEGMISLQHAIHGAGAAGGEVGGALLDDRARLLSTVDDKKDAMIIINATGIIMTLNKVC